MKRVVIRLDDQDRHGAGCGCGLCNSNGKSYGAAIFDVSTCLYVAEIEHAIDGADPLDRIYGPSEEAALENAKRVCYGHGWKIEGPAH